MNVLAPIALALLLVARGMADTAESLTPSAPTSTPVPSPVVERAQRPPPAKGGLGRWEHRSTFGPGRIFHSAIWTYSEMIIWGGGSEHQFYNSGGIYDPVRDQWRPVSEKSAPSGRWGHAAV